MPLSSSVIDRLIFCGPLRRSLQKKRMLSGMRNGKVAFTGPEHVVIDLTNRCNIRCIGCWTRSPLLNGSGPPQEWHQQELTYDCARKLIEDLGTMGTQIIRFTGGGEPFMHSGLVDLIRLAKSYGMFCAVTTNMRAIDENQVQRLYSIGLDELGISLWAAQASTYVATHPGSKKKDFEHIIYLLNTIKSLKRSSKAFDPRRFFPLQFRKTPLSVNLLNVICSLNYHEIFEMYQLAEDIHADSIYYTLLDPIPNATDSLLLSSHERQDVLNSLAKVESQAYSKRGSRNVTLDNLEGFRQRLQSEGANKGQYDQSSVNEIPCYVGWYFCRIMADGTVAPCCRGVMLPMGNLYKQNMKDIWYSRRYNWFRYKARYSPKSDRYFSKVGCQAMCDNLMHNKSFHHELKT